MAGVEGTDPQYLRMGVYTAEPGATQGGRPLYRSGLDQYLFNNTVGSWMIGTNHTGRSGGVKSTQQGFACPTDATSWDIADGGAFVPAEAVSITCTPTGTWICVTLDTAHSSGLKLPILSVPLRCSTL